MRTEKIKSKNLNQKEPTTLEDSKSVKQQYLVNMHENCISCNNQLGTKAFIYLSLTLEHGSIISSLAAMRATHPSTILFRYTNGVLPINCTTKCRNQISNIYIYTVLNQDCKVILQTMKNIRSSMKLTSVTSLAIPILSSAIFSD